MEGRIDQLVNEVSSQGVSPQKALKEVETSIERFVHYAGWADKYAQVHSSVNPVSSSHFNFSVPEPMGIVGIIPPNEPSLLGLATLLAPALAGGNVTISLVSETRPLAPATFCRDPSLFRRTPRSSQHSDRLPQRTSSRSFHPHGCECDPCRGFIDQGKKTY